jgi:3-oxo-5-alpha-steroid 4-dehydrogenase 3
VRRLNLLTYVEFAPQDVHVPQRWFSHFYCVGAATNLAVVVALGCLLSAEGGAVSQGRADATEQVAYFGLCLLQLHLARRLLESLLVFNYPEGARMHLIAYLFGLR